MTDTTPTPVDLDQVRADYNAATSYRPGATEAEHAAAGWAHEQLITEHVPAMVAEIAELRAALALASGGDTARDTVRRLLAKASDNAKRADTAEARVATLEKVAADNRAAYVDAVKDTRHAETERDEARARVDELETAHGEAEDNFRECRQLGRDAYLHAQHLGKVLAGVTTTLNAIANRIATDSRDWSTQRTDAWLYALLVGWGDAALAEVAADHGWTYEQVARITILRSYVAALTEPATEDAVPARTQEPQQ